MCGIVGAVAQRDVVDILVEGLRRLEYRGYDSAGVAVVDSSGELQRVRRLGKVKELSDAVHSTVSQASAMPTRMSLKIISR
jgi:glutamine---fructose-6-phosphate transaminase (isomerizing)